MCIRDSSAADPDSYAVYADKSGKIEGITADSRFTVLGNMLADNSGSIEPVSYTHLDVYKRQAKAKADV